MGKREQVRQIAKLATAGCLEEAADLHDRQLLSGADDVCSRCFTCSGVGHRAAECPFLAGATSGKAAGDGKPKGPNAKRIAEDAPVTGEQAKLISAATNLLEEMQAKALSERPSIGTALG